MATKIKKGDRVQVLTGKSKGLRGEVLKVITGKDRAVVQGVNMIKRHTKPNQAVLNLGDCRLIAGDLARREDNRVTLAKGYLLV